MREALPHPPGPMEGGAGGVKISRGEIPGA